MSSEVKYEIKRKLGVIGENQKGWTKEVNVISWNDRKPKIDIRDWDENHEKMGKGVTLNGSETAELLKLLQEVDLSDVGV